MNLVNHTTLTAELATQRDMRGFEYLLLVAKGTYRMPMGGEAAQLLDSQIPLHYADTATGEPGLSSPCYECEIVPPKAAAEVLLLGSAYAPQQKPERCIPVGLVIAGKLSKCMMVYGPRQWNGGLLSASVSEAAPILKQSISYDIAFGGAGHLDSPLSGEGSYAPNPIGIGYAKSIGRWLDGQAVAQTEPPGKPIRSPTGQHQPMSFGPIGRNWSPRASYAGTYNDAWLEDRYPLLPTDFDPRYFQAAPLDQQVSSLSAGDTIRLLNLVHPSLCQHGEVIFSLPDLSLQCHVHPRRNVKQTIEMQVDTLMIEPDQQRFSIIWKATYSLGNNPSSVGVVELGTRARMHFGRLTVRDVEAQIQQRKRLA